jgi:hypothetical protein
MDTTTTTDANTNITCESGESFQSEVRRTLKYFSDKVVAVPDNPDMVQDQFVLQQWRDIEEISSGLRLRIV